MTLLIDLQYFPSIIFYKNLSKYSNIVFEQYETYQKMSFRNRCQIAGAEGLINLSVPLVKGRDQKTLMKEVRISDRQPWQAQHWKTIVSCYNRSPWFEFYRHELEGLYQRRFDFLLDWNRSCFEWSLRVLGLSVPVSLTERYEKEYIDENVTDWRGKILPKNRGRSQDGGITQGSEGGQNEGGGQGGAVKPEDQPPKYRQVFEERIGFIPNLSVLDLLFCEGKEAIRYIRSS
jgi:WbqC-like protein family